MQSSMSQRGSVLRVAAFAIALAATYLGFIVTDRGQVLDSGSFAALSAVNGAAGAEAGLVRVGGPVLLAIVALAAAIGALVRRRWRAILQGAAIVALSIVVTEGVKFVLPRPDLGGHGYADNTFPSGHMTIATSLAFAIAVILPRRPGAGLVSAIGLAVAAVVGCASIVSYAHRPSDVIGAVLVVGGVESGVLWRRPCAAARGRVALGLTIAAALCVAGSAVAVVLGPDAIASSPASGVLGAAGWLALCTAVLGVTAATAADPRMPISSPGSRRPAPPVPAPPAEPGAALPRD